MELTPLPHVLFWLHGVIIFLWLWQVILHHPTLAWSFVLWFGGTFRLPLIHRPKVSLFLFELLLNLSSILVCHTKQGDVKELHFLLNVYVQKTTVL
jgi:hypothetical protein